MRRLSTACVLCLIVSAAESFTGAVLRAGEPISPSIEYPVVLTQVPVDESQTVLDWAKARLVLLTPGNNPRILLPDFAAACDPDVSFDGQRILFAGKRSPSDPWNVFELELNSRRVRRVLRDVGNCRHPVYQSTFFTIDSPEPVYQFTFVRSAAGDSATSLYSARLDGSHLRRLTYNLASDRDPVTCRDGRIVYSAVQRRTVDQVRHPRSILMGINADGTDPARVCAEAGEAWKGMPCESDGLLWFIENEVLRPDRAGRLACVETRRPLHTYRPITDPDDGLFHSPAPDPAGRLLVAFRPTAPDARQDFGLYLFDPQTKTRQALFDDRRYHELQAKAVVPRVEPDGRSSVVDEKDPYGHFYALDVYTTDWADEKTFPRGTAVSLRVIEAIKRADLGDTPTSSTSSFDVERRVLGEVPVENDGSFYVRVPANLTVELQLLDADGMALQDCGWIWVKNHSPQGCIGCHEDPERTPLNRVVDAVKKPPVVLDTDPDERWSLGFEEDVWPKLMRDCVPCHDSTAAPRLPRNAEESYRRLVTQPASPALPYIVPKAARRSPVVWHLLGRNTARPWDGEAAERSVKQLPPDAEIAPETIRTIIRWIDLGAQWKRSGAASQPDE